METHKIPDINTLAEILNSLSRVSAEPAELAEVAYLEIARLTEPDIFEMGLFETNTYKTLIRVVNGDRVENLQVSLSDSRPDLLGIIRSSGRSLLITDYEAERDVLGFEGLLTEKHMPLSGIYVPLRFGESILGVLSLRSYDSSAFSADDQRLLEVISACIAPALATSTLAGDLEQISTLSLLVQEISNLLTTLDPLPERISRIAWLLADVLDFEQISLLEFSEGELQLIFQSPSRNNHEVEQDTADIIMAAVGSGEIQSVVKNLETEEDPASQRREYAFPLQIVHHRLGALHICCLGGSEFSEDQLRLLETVGQQLAFAMLEARNYARQQEEAWITTVLLEVARHAAQPGDPIAALEAVLQLATLLVGTEWIVLLTPGSEPGPMRFITGAGLKRQQTFALTDLEFHIDSAALSPPYREDDEPIIIDLPKPVDDILQDDRALGLVLTDGQTLLGLLLAENELISGKQPALIAGIAHQVSLRLENTHLIEEAAAQHSLERELSMARDIQISFLPASVPEMSTGEIGVAWRVAREVGGDFYDFIPLPAGTDGDRLGIVIADVADKGIPAALYMALSRTLLRTLAVGFDDPGACLERVNQQLIRDAHGELFVSVFYAIWEPAVGNLSYANAGHNPPLLFTPRQRGMLLHDHGMVLGVQDSSVYRTNNIEIAPDQLLVLYTDGVTDAMDDNEDFFGIQRLESLVLGLTDWRPQSVADNIEQRVLRFTGQRELFDDLTTLTIHR